MTRISRANQRIFCGDVLPNNNIAVFGSLKADAPAFSDNADVVQSLPAWGQGWSGAAVSNQAPALQDMNALQWVFSRQLAYLMESGIPEYSATQVYYTNNLVNYNGSIYRSVTNDNLANAVTSGANWFPLLTRNIISVSANYAVVNGDYLVKASGSSMTITLPQAIAANVGQEHTIKSYLNAGAILTVVASGGSLIDIIATKQLSRFEALRVTSDGSNWVVN